MVNGSEPEPISDEPDGRAGGCQSPPEPRSDARRDGGRGEQEIDDEKCRPSTRIRPGFPWGFPKGFPFGFPRSGGCDMTLSIITAAVMVAAGLVISLAAREGWSVIDRILVVLIALAVVVGGVGLGQAIETCNDIQALGQACTSLE